jgi:hypothetical protein
MEQLGKHKVTDEGSLGGERAEAGPVIRGLEVTVAHVVVDDPRGLDVRALLHEGLELDLGLPPVAVHVALEGLLPRGAVGGVRLAVGG